MSAARAASIGEMRRRLPREFITTLSEVFSPNIVDKILHGMGVQRAVTLRVNTLRLDAGELMRFFRNTAVKHRRVLWYQDAFILTEDRERDVEGWAPYREGRIYVQSLSSMIPALALAPRPGESILDIAAAPGGKTAQIAALMSNRGFILANEASAVRAERLLYNLKLQGCGIAEVRVGPGEKLGGEMPERFDRVLLDVPCSGEGRFTSARPSTYRSWSPRIVGESARVQRRLIASGVKTLKPGGVLLYSTCTLNCEENEKMIQWALESFPLEVEAPPLRIPGIASGITDGLRPTIANAVRILPDREFEGFFLCRMRKKRKG
jgi:16S rRNA (cytosine1407-C5)-methyltransferase